MSVVAPMDRSAIERIVREIVLSQVGGPPGKPNLVVSISARHVHLTDQDTETLFGPGHKLTVAKDLYQEGYYAAEETVMVVGPRRRMLPSVRVLGPTRPETQVELAFTDGISLGIELPVRPSGNIADTPGAVLVGPQGSGRVEAGRDPRRAPRPHGPRRRPALRRRTTASACACGSIRPARRSSRTCWCGWARSIKLEVHLDTDEGNASDIDHARKVELLKRSFQRTGDAPFPQRKADSPPCDTGDGRNVLWQKRWKRWG